MAFLAKPIPGIRTVSISKRGAPTSHRARSLESPALGRPMLWLGATCPFGLALPTARPDADTMYAPRGVWLDDQRLIVCDSGNHRVLIWNQIPSSDQAAADVVLGQPNSKTEGPAAHGRGPENGLHLPTGVIVADGKLIVADAWHHRLLVWNKIPAQSDTPPDYAIGQPNLSDVQPNRGNRPSLAGLYWPYGIAWIDGKLYASDTGNRRVLVWNSIPESDKPADMMFGQSDADRSDENRGGPVAANSFRWPHDFAGYRGSLFVADAGNHRVLCWNSHPSTDIAADRVIGQRDFDVAYELPYDIQGPRRLRFPYAIDCCENVLAVADTANNRVLFWKLPLSDTRYPKAFDVIGQADFSGNGDNRWESVNKETLCWPYGISFHRGILAVADSGNNRVMLWDCRAILEHAKQAEHAK
tara:strand:+ start:75023 stop:76264 length:1242 start_codon:yes stop_codon:yes gene_type:complete